MSILVFVEHLDGKLKKQAGELVSYAAQISPDVTLLAIGKVSQDELAKMGRYGASNCIHIQEPGLEMQDNQAYARWIAEIAEKEGTDLIIMANSAFGKAMAPRLSVRLKAGLVAGVVDLPTTDQGFRVKKKVFNGKAFAMVQILTSRKILTLNSNACPLIEKPTELQYQVFSQTQVPATAAMELVEKSQASSGNLLTEASIVVSGGRGMRDPANWAHLETLAQQLNAALACSKPVSDEGWRSHSEHVGQTGKTIAPDLYVAVGISGAVQHLAGVSSSKTIVAINTDKEAPIFEVADYGMVADALEVLPMLIQSVNKLHSS